MSVYSVMNLSTGDIKIMPKDEVMKLYGEFLEQTLFACAEAVTLSVENVGFIRITPIQNGGINA